MMAFSSDASIVGGAFSNSTVVVWNAVSGDRIARFRGPAGPEEQPGALAISHDGNLIARGSSSGEVRVWEIPSGRISGDALGDGTPVQTISFSQDSQDVAWGSNSSLETLDLNSGKVTLNVAMPSVAAVVFDPQDKLLLINRMDGWTELRDPRSGTRLAVLSDRTPGEVEAAPANAARAAFNSDGTLIFNTIHPGMVAVFDALRQVGHSLPISMPANSDTRVGASLENVAAVVAGNIRVWQAQSGTPLDQWHAQTGRSPVRFSPDGSLLATGYSGNRLAIWNVATGALVETFTGHTAEIGLVEFSQDCSRVATASAEKTVRVWDIKTGHALATIHRPAQHIGLSPDGQLLAVASDSPGVHGVEIFDARSGHSAFVVRTGPDAEPGRAGVRPPERSTVNSVVFTPDGKELAVADDMGIWINDLKSGAPPARLEHRSPGGILGIKFTPDSARLGGVRADGAITIWAVGTEEPLLTLRGCGPKPVTFDFGTGGAACVGRDGSVHTWGTVSKHYPGARQLVDSLLRRHLVVADVVDRLRRDTTIDEPLRKAAIAEAQTRREVPMQFEKTAQ